jgi:hypothetical protein
MSSFVNSVVNSIVSTFLPETKTKGSFLDLYTANNFTPELVADFKNSVYAKDGAASTFSGVIQHSRSGAARMVDSDGLEKWSPHNFVPYSESMQGATTSSLDVTPMAGGDGPISDYALLTPTATLSSHGLNGVGIASVVDGAQYTVECYAKAGGSSFIQIDTNSTATRYANFDLSGGGAVGTLGSNTESAAITALANGWFRLQMVYVPSATNQVTRIFVITSATADRRESWTATGTETVLLTGVRSYRSDLGGMVDNPETGDSYVPTEATSVFLPRRNAHVWDGSAWVNEGLLHEEAGTNLLLNSNDFTAASWFASNTGTLLKDAIGPDGELSATTLIDSNAGGTGFVFVRESVTVTPASLYTASVFAKADQLSDMLIYLVNFTTPPNDGVYFDLSAGTAQVNGAATFVSKQIVDCGNGWYRCSITFETDAADTTGDVNIYPVNSGEGGAEVDLDGTSSILIYGAQFEEGSIPTSYIPTLGAQATRTADTATILAADMPDLSSAALAGKTALEGNSWVITDGGAA